MVSEAFVKIYFFFLLFNVAAFMIQATIDQAQTEGMPNTDAVLAFTTQHINDRGFILDGFDNFGNSIGLDFPDEIKIGFAVVIGFLTFFWLLYVFLGRST